MCTPFATCADTPTAADIWQSCTYSNTALEPTCAPCFWSQLLPSPRTSGTCSSLLSCSQILLALTATKSRIPGRGCAPGENAAKPRHATFWPPSLDTMDGHVHEWVRFFPNAWGSTLDIGKLKMHKPHPRPLRKATCMHLAARPHALPTNNHTKRRHTATLAHLAQVFTCDSQLRQPLHVERPTLHKRSNVPLTRSSAFPHVQIQSV